MTGVAVSKYTGSLLVGEMAVVGFYTKTEISMKFTEEKEDVMYHAIEKIKGKKKVLKNF